MEVYGLTDQSERVLELRRLDGQMFPATGVLGERKSHAVKGSQKNWPVGILEAQPYPMIMLVEGIPDFLAAHQIILLEGAADRVAPVAMLSATASIHTDALALFKAKHVRVFPHVDQAGIQGATSWRNQLHGAGAARVDFVDLSQFKCGREKIKDLCDFKDSHAVRYFSEPKEWRVLL